jgi:hypothetical protein
MKFRKKPVVIDAVIWTGSNTEEVSDFCKGGLKFSAGDTHLGLTIPTLEGDHQANPGDYIIRGVKGEYYPCKPDIFVMTYEPAE